MKRIATLALLSLFIAPSIAQVAINERLEISGFARLVAGYLDAQDVTYQGYSDSISVSQQSLLGLQAEFSVTDQLTLVAQGLAHSGDDRESGLEWLYFSYEPSQYLQFKLGKLRTPFFKYSDVLDVGFAYPWITPPQQAYSSYLFSNYEGISGTVKFPLQYFSGSLEVYYGQFSDELLLTGQRVYADIEKLSGMAMTLDAGSLNFRASYHQTDDFDVRFAVFDEFSDILRDAGFTRTADSLEFDDSVQVFQLSTNYDNLMYFGSIEWMRIATDILLSPEVDSVYFTAGYHYYPFQFYATYATSDISYRDGINEIPVGLVPELDQLQAGYEALLARRPVDNLDSLALGIRWDVMANLAFKAEWTILDGERDARAFFEKIDNPDFSRNANLYQLAIEWVF